MHEKTLVVASRAETVREFIGFVVAKQGDWMVGQAADEAALAARLARSTPDVVLMETSFMGPDTPAYIEALVGSRRGLRVAAFTLEGCAPRRAAVFVDRGADSFVCFHLDLKEVLKALESLNRGERYLPLAVARAVDARDLHPVARGDLTAREREVGRLIAWGHTVREIAQCLGLSVKTVDSHRTHIYGKTDCRKRSEFVAYAVRAGLLTEEDPC